MHRLTAVSLCLALLAAGSACGGKKDADNPKSKSDGDGGGGGDGDDSTASGGGDKDKDGGGGGGEGPKKDDCVGFDVAALEDTLSKAACEVPNAKPDTQTPVDMKGKIEVKVDASPTKTAAGGKVDLVVSIANKTKDPITLMFRIDPTPRFDVEVYDKKNKRADMPAGHPPDPPKGHSPPPPADAKTAKLTLAPGGTARQRVPWEATKMAWAPEKVRGTPVERGFPRKPAGPLAKGKYTIKLQTPLVGVAEGIEHEVSAPKVEIEVN